MKKLLLAVTFLVLAFGCVALAQGVDPCGMGTEEGTLNNWHDHDQVDPCGMGTEDGTAVVDDPCAIDQGQQPTSSGIPMYIPLILMFVVLYFFMFRGPKKRQQEYKKMLDELKKGAKVRTIGGIIGTVLDVRDDEVVVKIDETTNTKMRFARSAISKIYNEDGTEVK